MRVCVALLKKLIIHYKVGWVTIIVANRDEVSPAILLSELLIIRVANEKKVSMGLVAYSS
jgi:hypothetical protein